VVCSEGGSPRGVSGLMESGEGWVYVMGVDAMGRLGLVSRIFSASAEHIR
jgi:hypothetical protein